MSRFYIRDEFGREEVLAVLDAPNITAALHEGRRQFWHNVVASTHGGPIVNRVYRNGVEGFYDAKTFAFVPQ